MKALRLSAGLFRSTPLQYWPKLIWYFIGLAIYRVTRVRLFSQCILTFRPFRMCASIEGLSGLGFLHEILAEKIYDFDLLRADETIRVIFDAGANCGFFALTESARNKSVRIYCFEPHPRTAERLRTNIRINNREDRIFPVHAAVGSTCGTCELNTSRESSMGVVSTSETQYVKAELVVQTPLLTLDSFAAEHEVWPDLLKVDVEGFEVEVLGGAKKCLKRARHVILEFHSQSLLAECQRLLTEAGFRNRLCSNSVLIGYKTRGG